MQNISTCTTQMLGKFMTELAHTGLKCHCKDCTKPQERKQQRQTENNYLIHEIVSSLMTS
jgi:hypothetical protein